MSLGSILLILRLLVPIGAIPTWSYSRPWGFRRTRSHEGGLTSQRGRELHVAKLAECALENDRSAAPTRSHCFARKSVIVMTASLPTLLQVVSIAVIPVVAASLGAVTAALRPPGRVVRKRVLAPTGIASLMIVGAMAGRTLLADASVHTLAGMLSFGCAALLFLVTEELLVEAHESADTAVTTTMFFLGFLIFLLLGMLE